MVRSNILETIGNTPLLCLSRTYDHPIHAKAEFLNPGGSIKDRVAKYILEDAEQTGKLRPGQIVAEATSGNTGIGVTLVGVQRGYRVRILMPENMSEERKKIIRALGGELILTPAEEGIEGAVSRLKKMAQRDSRIWVVGQFENPLNPEVHHRFTGPEIWDALGADIDAFVAGVGSGGTLGGVGRFLKSMKPSIKVVAVEPANAAALLGQEPGLHQIQGIGDGFVPPVLDTSIIDAVVTVTDDDAIETTRTLARSEGLLVGTSSGANVWAAHYAAQTLGFGRRVVTVLPDRAERYFSTALL
ncbi:MAG: cysteine synthase A [bacterium]